MTTDGLAVVKPHLQPLSGEELQGLLKMYPAAGKLQGILSVSQRPYSAASLVRTDCRDVFVKKRPATWRSREDLQREHALNKHLVEKGFPTPAVLENEKKETLVIKDNWFYEVFARAEGEDLYKHAHSWMPFASTDHARSAGQVLAHLHQVVADFPIRSAREVSPMSGRFELARDADLIHGIEALSTELPALGSYLATKEWREAVKEAYQPFYNKVHKALAALPRCYTHGDWHANNLFFKDGTVSAVIDFHLADYSYRLYDLVVALDRNALLWLEIVQGKKDAVWYDGLQAMLTGYQEVTPLTNGEKAILPEFLAIHQLDLALTNIAYYYGVEGNRERADWAYNVYLLEHTRFFSTKHGQDLLSALGALLMGEKL